MLEDGVPNDYVSIVMDFGWEHVTNGQLNPTLTYKKGEHVHFRTVGAGIEPQMYLSIENHTLLPYAMDGYPAPKPSEVEMLTLDTGVRAEFLVKFDTPGTYKVSLFSEHTKHFMALVYFCWHVPTPVHPSLVV